MTERNELTESDTAWMFIQPWEFSYQDAILRFASQPQVKKKDHNGSQRKEGEFFFFENCIKVPRIFEKRALIFAVNRTSSSSQSHLSHYFSIQLESVYFKKIGFLKNGL